MPIHVFVATRSAVARRAYTTALDQAAGIQVVGTATALEVIWSRIQRLRPHVVVLEVGLASPTVELARSIVAHQPTIGVVEAGDSPQLVDMLARVVQASHGTQGTAQVAEQLPHCVRAVVGEFKAALRAKSRIPSVQRRHRRPELIALGSSTGGAAALGRILPMFPRDAPPIVVVDHMPEGYTRDFAERLDGLCKMRVVEAENHQLLEPGIIAIAPGGDRHLQVVRRGGQLKTLLVEAPPTDGHRPSVTELFQSVARVVGRNAAAGLLTGMGRDGASGLLALRNAGGFTVVQDAATSVVYGMPKVAYIMGAATEQLPLDDIPARLLLGQA